MMNKELFRKCLVYGIAIVLLVASFLLPPMGIIDNSVLMAVSIMIAGHEWIFGHSIKSIHIDKSGVHIETHQEK